MTIIFKKAMCMHRDAMRQQESWKSEPGKKPLVLWGKAGEPLAVNSNINMWYMSIKL